MPKSFPALSRTACLPRRLAAALVFLAVVAATARAEPLPVIAVPVVEDDFVDALEALGTLRANETARLTSTITETIAEIRFEDGDRVSRGDVLVVMTNSEQQADLDAAEADVDEAERQYQRVVRLADSGQESQAELDERRRQIDSARARQRAVEARLRERTITAPFDGVLGLRNVSVGSLLSPGEQITTIHDDATMRLDFSVPETLLAVVTAGTGVVAQSRAFADETFTGEVTSIDNEVDPVTRSIAVRARLPNPDGKLRPGMLMTIELAVNPRMALVVPEEALLPEGRDNYVFVAEDDGNGGIAARRQAVRIGARRIGEVEVLDGVSAGEIVVSHGGMRLSDGQTITVRNDHDSDESLADMLRRGRDGQ